MRTFSKNKNIIIICLLLFTSGIVNSQNKTIDKLYSKCNEGITKSCDRIISIAMTGQNLEQSIYALSKIDNQETLVSIAINSVWKDVRMDACKRITNQSFLPEIIGLSKDNFVRNIAFNKINSPHILVQAFRSCSPKDIVYKMRNKIHKDSVYYKILNKINRECLEYAIYPSILLLILNDTCVRNDYEHRIDNILSLKDLEFFKDIALNEDIKNYTQKYIDIQKKYLATVFINSEGKVNFDILDKISVEKDLAEKIVSYGIEPNASYLSMHIKNREIIKYLMSSQIHYKTKLNLIQNLNAIYDKPLLTKIVLEEKNDKLVDHAIRRLNISTRNYNLDNAEIKKYYYMASDPYLKKELLRKIKFDINFLKTEAINANEKILANYAADHLRNFITDPNKFFDEEKKKIKSLLDTINIDAVYSEIANKSKYIEIVLLHFNEFIDPTQRHKDLMEYIENGGIYSDIAILKILSKDTVLAKYYSDLQINVLTGRFSKNYYVTGSSGSGNETHSIENFFVSVKSREFNKDYKYHGELELDYSNLIKKSGEIDMYEICKDLLYNKNNDDYLSVVNKITKLKELPSKKFEELLKVME